MHVPLLKLVYMFGLPMLQCEFFMIDLLDLFTENKVKTMHRHKMCQLKAIDWTRSFPDISGTDYTTKNSRNDLTAMV